MGLPQHRCCEPQSSWGQPAGAGRHAAIAGGCRRAATKPASLPHPTSGSRPDHRKRLDQASLQRPPSRFNARRGAIPSLDRPCHYIRPARKALAGPIGQAVFNPAAVFLRVRANQLHLNNPAPSPPSSIAQGLAGNGQGIDAISNNRQPKPQIVLCHGIGSQTPNRPRVHPLNTQSMFNAVNPQVNRPQAPAQRPRQRRLPRARQARQADQHGRHHCGFRTTGTATSFRRNSGNVQGGS